MSKQKTRAALGLWNDSEQKEKTNMISDDSTKECLSEEHITESDLLQESDETLRRFIYWISWKMMR